MSSDAITHWLGRKRRRGVVGSAAYAMVTILGGAFVLALTFYFLFVAAKVVLLSLFPLSPFVTAGSAVVGLVISGLIFADSLRSRRDDMSFLPAWLLREYISIGPRLILEGLPHVTRARHFVQMDLESCARALSYLAGQSTPSSREELLRALPGIEWTNLAGQLRLLPGVIFFRPEGRRVVLTAPLRLELRSLLARQRLGGAPEPEAPVSVNEPHQLEPCEILGVASGASLAQIKKAYRDRIKECHPDRFAAMDETARALAEEWTKSLNAAYESLVAQSRR